MLNQLFRIMPSEELCMSVLNAFGLTSLHDKRQFTRKDIVSLETVEKIKVLLPILSPYYLPCKARSYLSELNAKNIITILRHFVRIFGHKVNSREKYIKGEKFIVYSLCPVNQVINTNTNFSRNDGTHTVNFD
jgi:hypothetical protein